MIITMTFGPSVRFLDNSSLGVLCPRLLLPVSLHLPRPPVDPTSSSHIIQAQAQNSPCPLLYVELLPDEASRHVFIVGICERRDCGADMGGGSCPVSLTPYQ